jgi:hypothetical protein
LLRHRRHGHLPELTVDRTLAAAIYAALGANILVLWVARGDFVNGWDLFGATFGVLTLDHGSFAEGIANIVRAVINQRRPVFTGGESLIYGLVPALLNNMRPWLLWTHLLNLVIFIVVSFWLVRRLRCRPHVFWACVLASPAMVSQSIVGLPDLPSNVLPYSIAIAWVLWERQPERRGFTSFLLDVVVLGCAAGVAFNGYESGKTFFVVPALAAFTLPRIGALRRATWLACATAMAGIMHNQASGTVRASLSAIPRDPAALAQASLAVVRGILGKYFISWYIDFPALAVAAVVSLFFLKTRRAFWASLLITAWLLVSINVFQLSGAFLVPHRFLLVGFVSALVVTVFLSQSPPRRAALPVALLLLAGAVYTTFVTAAFATEDRFRGHRRDLVYPLPYNRASVDAAVMPEKIRDAAKLVALLKTEREPHVFFYGFSVVGEDSVNPQLLPSRLLLPLGYTEFMSRVRFFDHADVQFFRFPITKLSELPGALSDLPPRFYVHIKEPEYSAASILAKYFNRGHASPVDLGLETLTSYYIEDFASPGPMPIARRDTDLRRAGADGLCFTTWTEPTIYDRNTLPLPSYIDRVLPLPDARDSPKVGKVSRALVTTPAGAVGAAGPGGSYFTGYFENDSGAPIRTLVTVRSEAQQESLVAVVMNDLTVIEWRSWSTPRESSQEVLLPPGNTELKVLNLLPWSGEGVRFSTVDENTGVPIPWRCVPDLGATDHDEDPGTSQTAPDQ